MLHIEKLVELRKQKGLIQQNMADLLNITRSAYNKYEKGKAQPPNEALAKIADFFGVSSDYLLGSTDDPTPPSAKKEAPLPISDRDALKIFAESQKGGPLTQDELDRLYDFAVTFIKGLKE